MSSVTGRLFFRTKASRKIQLQTASKEVVSIEIVQIVISAVTGSGVTAIILALLQRKWARDDKSDAIVEALKVLMVDRVRHLGQAYIAAGSVSLSDKEALEEMHRAYKALGGNGHLNTVMEEVDELPIRKG